LSFEIQHIKNPRNSILKCFVKKKDGKDIYIYTKKFENKMFMKIVRPCWLLNMRYYVGCKIVHKVTLNEEKNKEKKFNLIFFIDVLSINIQKCF